MNGLYLDDNALEQLGITPPEMADAIEDAIRAKAAGQIQVTPKSVILPGDGRYLMSTLATGMSSGLTVLKTATVAPENRAKGLPGITGAILALDAMTGVLKATLEAGWITAHRTAGLSTIAARRLAKPDAKIVSFIGCGVQAASHLDAFAAQFPLTEIRALGRSPGPVQALCKKAREMGLKAHEVGSPEAALHNADLVVSSITLDYGVKPFLDARLLKPGAFAAITDLGIPWIDASWDAFGTVVVDDLEQERASEKPLLPLDKIATDLEGLVTGRDAAPRHEDAPNALAFRGIAIGDYAATSLVLDRAGKAAA